MRQASTERDPLEMFGRAYSTLNIKAVDEDQRVITGIATSPEPDRVGDIVEPMGISFKNPAPLLWQHRSSEPVGLVKFDRPTKDGMTFSARLPKVDEPGRLKDRVDEAWQSIKLGLVRAVSIGFRAVEMSFMDDGGIRFLKTEVLELSLVTIPANAQANIQTIKAIDAPLLAASGDPAKDSEKFIGWLRQAATANRPASRESSKAKAMKTIQEQMTEFSAQRDAAQAKMQALMAKAADAQETLTSDESDEYDGLQIKVEGINKHLARLADLDRINKQSARPIAVTGSESAAEARGVSPAAHVDGNGSTASSVAIASPGRSPVISVRNVVPKGTAFTRYCMAVAGSRGNRWEALNLVRSANLQDTPEVEKVLETDIAQLMRTSSPEALQKAAQGAGDTINPFAAPLVAYTVMASEFVELLRPETIIGRIPGLRRVPFNIQMPRTTSGTSVGWVGEGAPKPVTGMSFETITFRWAKAAGIVVLTQELVRFSNPSAESVVRQDLIAAMAQFLDRQFVDPSVAAVTNVSPASITNGVTPVTATGVTADAFRTDVRSLFANLFALNLSGAGGVWLMTNTQALALSMMLNALGQREFPDITANGGTLLGYPVVASENMPATGNSPVDGYPIIFMIPREVMLADDGQVVIDASDQASVQMDTAPDSPPTASTNMVSLWQNNLVGLRAERWINWAKRRAGVVQFIQNAKYTG